jgi:hypothetical protein
MANDGYVVPAGKSILEILWEDLMATLDTLMNSEDLVIDDPDLNRTKGRAEGVAWSIAVMTHSPRTPDINLIKAEAMEKWEAAQEA